MLCVCVFFQWQFLSCDDGEANLEDDEGWQEDEGNIERSDFNKIQLNICQIMIRKKKTNYTFTLIQNAEYTGKITFRALRK